MEEPLVVDIVEAETAARRPYKLLLLAVTVILGGLFFVALESPAADASLAEYRLLYAFGGGLFLAYAFTAASGAAIITALGSHGDGLLVWVVASLGAVLGDLIIFRFVRHELVAELDVIKHWRVWLAAKRMGQRLPERVRRTIQLVVAGILIASPLPDEFGIVLLASSRTISTRLFVLVAYLLNAAGIAALLMLGRVVPS